MEKIVAVFIGFFGLMQAGLGGDIPHFQSILDAQIKCDSKIFDRMSWSKNEGLEGLDTSSIAIISKPVVTDITSTTELQNNERVFITNYTGYKYFVCGATNAMKPEQVTGKKREAFWIIEHSMEDKNKLTIVEDQNRVKNSDERASPRFLWHEDGGLNCIVYIDDLIKDPSVFPLDKLCKGKPGKDQETTKKAIEQAVKTWKAAGVGK